MSALKKPCEKNPLRLFSIQRISNDHNPRSAQRTLAKTGFALFSKWPPFSLIRPVSIPNLGMNRFCSFSKCHFHWLEPGPHTKLWQEPVLFLSKWPQFSLVRTGQQLSIPNPGKNQLCSFLNWPPFSLVWTGVSISNNQTLAGTGFVPFKMADFLLRRTRWVYTQRLVWSGYAWPWSPTDTSEISSGSRKGEFTKIFLCWFSDGRI